MEVFRINNMINGDILLEKIIIDMNNMIIENKENGDILLKKKSVFHINDFYK